MNTTDKKRRENHIIKEILNVASLNTDNIIFCYFKKIIFKKYFLRHN